MPARLAALALVPVARSMLPARAEAHAETGKPVGDHLRIDTAVRGGTAAAQERGLRAVERPVERPDPQAELEIAQDPLVHGRRGGADGQRAESSPGRAAGRAAGTRVAGASGQHDVVLQERLGQLILEVTAGVQHRPAQAHVADADVQRVKTAVDVGGLGMARVEPRPQLEDALHRRDDSDSGAPPNGGKIRSAYRLESGAVPIIPRLLRSRAEARRTMSRDRGQQGSPDGEHHVGRDHPGHERPVSVVGGVAVSQAVADEVLAADDRAVERDVRKARPDAGIDERHLHALAEHVRGEQRSQVQGDVVDRVGAWRGRGQRANPLSAKRGDRLRRGLGRRGRAARIARRSRELDNEVLANGARFDEAADRCQRSPGHLRRDRVHILVPISNNPAVALDRLHDGRAGPLALDDHRLGDRRGRAGQQQARHPQPKTHSAHTSLHVTAVACAATRGQLAELCGKHR